MAHSESWREPFDAAGQPTQSLGAAWPALAAALLGLFLIVGAGFAQPRALHDAAHDARHGFGFPCH